MMEKTVNMFGKKWRLRANWDIIGSPAMWWDFETKCWLETAYVVHKDGVVATFFSLLRDDFLEQIESRIRTVD